MGGRKVQTGLSPVLEPRLVNDAETDRVARSHARAIRELQGLIAAGARLVENVELADATDVPVHHGLGRPPRWVGPSAVRNGVTGGAVLEVRSASSDRSDAVILRAVGYGATVTIDLLVL